MGSSSFKVPFSLIILRFALMGHLAYAEDSQTHYLNTHNAARSEVGVPPLAWDETVARFALDYANQRKGDCQLLHSGGGGRYGENLASSSSDQMSSSEAVGLWVDEKRDYDSSSNSCVEGGVCVHYTQVVWRDTLRVGCAKVRCDNGGTFLVCNYDPPGNYVGQRPYKLK